MPMNIAMLSYHTCPLAILGGKNTGGMNVYVRELTRHLGMHNVHVDVFTRSENEHVPHVLHDLGFGNRVVHIPAGPEVTLPKLELVEHIDTFAHNILAFSESKKIKYDLIHAHYWMSGIAGAQLKAAWSLPMLTMFHTLGLVKQTIARSSDEMEGDYRIQGEIQAIAAADQIIAATASERDQLTSLYNCQPDKIAIIPPGVDTAHFYPIDQDEAKEAIDIPTSDRMVLFVGRIEPLKGIDTLIRAMAILKLECGQCPHYLVIIGGDADLPADKTSDEMARLQNLCSSLGLDEVILFLGKRGQDTLSYYYSAADLLVMPSFYESFGMVALEAMACSTPVIASDVGGLSHLIQHGETGFLVPSQDPVALADTMRNILQNDELRQQIGKKAVTYAQQYDWTRISARILNLYTSRLSSHP